MKLGRTVKKEKTAPLREKGGNVFGHKERKRAENSV